jgi:hypothetical protein
MCFLCTPYILDLFVGTKDICQKYEGVYKSLRTGRLERKLQIV